jgi:hypothetical protein
MSWMTCTVSTYLVSSVLIDSNHPLMMSAMATIDS